MKINFNHNISRMSMLGLALAAAMQSFTISEAVALEAGKGGRGAAQTPRTLTEQIRQHIHAEDLQIRGLQKGIIVLSFQLDQNNEMRQVVSHSQNASLDGYLKASLEGKQILGEGRELAKDQTQFVKLRISIEK